MTAQGVHCGHLLDNRQDRTNIPSYDNLIKKSPDTLKSMLIDAIGLQLKELKENDVRTVLTLPSVPIDERDAVWFASTVGRREQSPGLLLPVLFFFFFFMVSGPTAPGGVLGA